MQSAQRRLAGSALLSRRLAMVAAVSLVAIAVLGLRGYRGYHRQREMRQLIDGLIGEEEKGGTAGGSYLFRDPLKAKGGFRNNKAMELHGDAHAIGLLVTALEDEDPEVRSVAARALGWAGDSHGVGPLLDRLEREQDPWTREMCIRALAQFNEPDVVAALIRASSDPDENIREAAAQTLHSMEGLLPGGALLKIAQETEFKENDPESYDRYVIHLAKSWIREQKEAIGRLDKSVPDSGEWGGKSSFYEEK